MSAPQSKQTKKLFGNRRCKRTKFANKTDGGFYRPALTAAEPERLDLELERHCVGHRLDQRRAQLLRPTPWRPARVRRSGRSTRTACWPAPPSPRTSSLSRGAARYGVDQAFAGYDTLPPFSAKTGRRGARCWVSSRTRIHRSPPSRPRRGQLLQFKKSSA
jgi:hypothetical protein